MVRKFTISPSLLVLILVLAVGAFHFYLKKNPEESLVEKYASYLSLPMEIVGKTAPECEFLLLSGEKVNLSDLVGKKCIVINFFSTWCEPCRREIPSLNKFYGKFSPEQMFMVAISSEKRETVEKFLKENKISFPVAVDSGEIEEKFAIDSYPTTVVIDTHGRIRFYESGAIYNTAVTLEPVVQKVITLVESGNGISREEFLRMSKVESSLGLKPEKSKKKLTEEEKKIARKIYCPRGCGRNLIDCDCTMCKKAIGEMREEMEKGKSETEIVRIINTRYCAVKND